MDEKYIYEEVNKLITDKSYVEKLLDYCFYCFFNAERIYDSDYDSNKLVYNFRLTNETITVKFDVENIYHILGLPNYRVLAQAEIIKRVLLDKYNINISDKSSSDKLIRKIKNVNHLKMISNIFKTSSSEIKKFDCDSLNKVEKKLNWDKFSYKLFCFLNIGNLTIGSTSYYEKIIEKGNKKEKLFKRQLLSTNYGDEYSLTIQFVEEIEIEPRSGFKKVFYSPKSIRIEKIPKKSVFVRETIQDKKLKKNQHSNSEKFKYMGEVTINKQFLKVKGGN